MHWWRGLRELQSNGGGKHQCIVHARSMHPHTSWALTATWICSCKWRLCDPCSWWWNMTKKALVSQELLIVIIPPMQTLLLYSQANNAQIWGGKMLFTRNGVRGARTPSYILQSLDDMEEQAWHMSMPRQKLNVFVKNRGRFYAAEETICACVYVRERERVETQGV